MKRKKSTGKKAQVGKFGADQFQILSEASPFSIKEGYKALRTNVIFSLPGTDSKCIGLTSAARTEGKSTTAINLGIAFSQIGKRAILLDCDLRLPTIAFKLRLSKQPGLSNLIVGEASFSEVVQHYCENFDVITAGQIPRDPTGLLASEQMKYLLTKLKEYYDYVIVDLPPVNTVTDAAILTDSIDGYLLVVRHGVTDYREVGEMLHQLKLSDAKIMGFVYSGAPISEKKYYQHYYA